jgi:hypothetical protein
MGTVSSRPDVGTGTGDRVIVEDTAGLVEGAWVVEVWELFQYPLTVDVPSPVGDDNKDMVTAELPSEDIRFDEDVAAPDGEF